MCASDLVRVHLNFCVFVNVLQCMCIKFSLCLSVCVYEGMRYVQCT